MVCSELRLAAMEGSAVEGLRLVQFALVVQQRGQVVDGGQRVGVVRPRLSLETVKDPAVEGLCLLQPALGLEEVRQVVGGGQGRCVTAAELRLPALDGLLQPPLAVRIGALHEGRLSARMLNLPPRGRAGSATAAYAARGQGSRPRLLDGRGRRGLRLRARGERLRHEDRQAPPGAPAFAAAVAELRRLSGCCGDPLTAGLRLHDPLQRGPELRREDGGRRDLVKRCLRGVVEQNLQVFIDGGHQLDGLCPNARPRGLVDVGRGTSARCADLVAGAGNFEVQATGICVREEVPSQVLLAV
mmetsp:Transcript_38902/g.97735  ORF Transcript_38902/g.97735 Transcript_38902/m.97735 type:complete len:300 (-) Transcript_38902:285-1184(-)